MQTFVNGMVAGCAYALFALGFGLIFRVGRFFHFTHGTMYTIGAYAAYALIHMAGLSSFIAVPLSILATGLIGWVLAVGVYRPLRLRGASSLVLLIASIGLSITLQNVLSLLFGDSARRLSARGVAGGWEIADAHLTSIQAIIIAVAAVLFLAVWCWLRWTQVGIIFRAVSSDPELSHVVGIRTESVVGSAFAIGSSLAGVAGILCAYDTDLEPMMGSRVLVVGMTAVVIGGINSTAGTALIAVLIGLGQHAAVWMLPAAWQDTIVFSALMCFLVLRPRGLFGERSLRSAM
jgi:branched-chain amino acid transport system permease protein